MELRQVSDAVKKSDFYTESTAVWLEVQAFKDRNPQYFACQHNMRVVLDYLQRNNMLVNYDNLEEAFAWAQGEGKLFTPSAESFAKMTAAEVKQMAQENGIPQFNESGDLLGYAFPDTWGKVAPVDLRKIKAREMRHPEDLKHKPSRREWAMWDADRSREYLQATGHWGHELPKDFFRD